MRREEILEAATGVPMDEIVEARQYRQITNYPEQNDIWSIIGLDKRRVIVRNSQNMGPDIGTAATTVTVTALMHLYTVEEHRHEGHAQALILSALEESSVYRLVPYVALFSPPDLAGFFERLGFKHPEKSPDGFMVYELTDQPWPDGSVDTRGSW